MSITRKNEFLEENLANKSGEDVVERDNNSLGLLNNEEATMKWEGSKATVDGVSRIDLRLIDLANGDVLQAISSEGTDMVPVYTDIIQQGLSVMTSKGINPLKIKLPQLDDLENF